MEKSAKWGFNLPNSNNEEIADINVITVYRLVNAGTVIWDKIIDLSFSYSF